ncbi:hypothetical protein [Pseudomonas sp. MS19]|uniref:hypothetical protein n=1 Tax=Pseudomonas sp. MS19 TaxID=2579939 RepID=UPI001562DB21|nr:hypothetical protein [Pseudomonas sp. MS19]NRH26814.1 hypothetical protein [Pseudomonas sp. MS19]
MTDLVVSCENKGELESILSLLDEVLTINKGFNVTIFNSMSLYSQEKFEDSFDNIVSCKRLFSGQFKTLNVLLRFIESLYIALQLYFLMRSKRSTVLVVGVSLVYHRVLKFLLRDKLLLVSVVRSIIVQGADDIGFKKHLRRLGLIGSVGDVGLTTGPVTSRYLGNNMVRSIYDVGPFDIDKCYEASSKKDLNYTPQAVVFITSAFSWHGDYKGQCQQVEFCRELAVAALADGLRFFILVHPRDNKGQYESLGLDVEIVSGGLGKCIQVNENFGGAVCFVSMVSTLSFELAYIELQSKLMVPKSFYENNSTWYESVGVKPLVDIQSGWIGYGQIDCSRVFNLSNRGRVAQEAAALLVREFNKHE